VFIDRLRKEQSNLLFNACFILTGLFMIVAFYEHILYLTLALLALCAVALVRWRSRMTTTLFVIGGVFGVSIETVAVHYGVWSYAVTHIMNTPFWLVLAWGAASAFLYEATKELQKLGYR
jgi:hypothetical protein